MCSRDPAFLTRAILCLEPNTQKARRLAIEAAGSRATGVSPLLMQFTQLWWTMQYSFMH